MRRTLCLHLAALALALGATSALPRIVSAEAAPNSETPESFGGRCDGQLKLYYAEEPGGDDLELIRMECKREKGGTSYVEVCASFQENGECIPGGETPPDDRRAPSTRPAPGSRVPGPGLPQPRPHTGPLPGLPSRTVVR